LAKIAVELERALARRRERGTPGTTTPRIIAGGEGWSVADVLCTSGPRDHSFEEQHPRYTLAIVLSGSFQYRSSGGGGLMTPGSLMLGNQGCCFECRHEHGEGDRCLSIWYSPEYFERVAADAGARGRRVGFTTARLPPLRSLSSLVVRSAAGAVDSALVPWEELSIELAVRAMALASGTSSQPSNLPLNAEARVTNTIRAIERHMDAALTLEGLARRAGLSRYHFLRTFERVTGSTPHQYVLRARLREAARRLISDEQKVVDIALDCGFGDVSNFNRAFRTEFGESPRTFRGSSS
jgi:AraC family transcriptional regulator